MWLREKWSLLQVETFKGKCLEGPSVELPILCYIGRITVHFLKFEVCA